MTTVTMLEFRQNADAIIRKVQGGESLLLTYRGKPAVRLEPVEDTPSEDAPSGETNLLLSLCELGEKWVEPGPTTSLTNEDIDRIVYGL